MYTWLARQILSMIYHCGNDLLCPVDKEFEKERQQPTRKNEVFRLTSYEQNLVKKMADADKLGLGLDDIIRHDRTTNRRGGTGRGGGRGGFRGRGQSNGFRTRGGGGLVNNDLVFTFPSLFQFHLASNIQSTSRSMET